MHLSRFAILIGFLFVEATAVTLSVVPFRPTDSQQQKMAPNLPILAKQPVQSQFAPRFEQTEPIIAGDTFYYSSLPSSLAAPTAVARTETHTFVILFNFDSSRLNAKSELILDNIVNTAKRGQQIRIFATGHTDTSGPDSYNQVLSRQRVEAVQAAIIERGITPEVIDKEAFGETRPRIATPDGLPHSRNRRVEIIVGPAPKI